MVRMKGLEPPSLAALDSKSSTSTSSVTSAYPLGYLLLFTSLLRDSLVLMYKNTLRKLTLKLICLITNMTRSYLQKFEAIHAFNKRSQKP